MQVTYIAINNFRCFKPFGTALSSLVLIKGHNGAGKTSLLEALHYACYLRSFRTHLPREMIAFDQQSFSITIKFLDHDGMLHDLMINVVGSKRLVKLNGKVIQTYQELLPYYSVVTLTADDMSLIQGNPEDRRTFFDQTSILLEPNFLKILRQYRHIVDQRNALLKTKKVDVIQYNLWTDQLLVCSENIQNARMRLLEKIQLCTNNLLSIWFDSYVQIELYYKNSYQELSNQLMSREICMGRSLIGAHLDDIVIQLNTKKSKAYASRGQQKLIILLLKVAKLLILKQAWGAPLFLLDDIMADFDHVTLEKCTALLIDTGCQLIFTSPISEGFFEQRMIDKGAQELTLFSS